jgi:hypothetical protein
MLAEEFTDDVTVTGVVVAVPDVGDTASQLGRPEMEKATSPKGAET